MLQRAWRILLVATSLALPAALSAQYTWQNAPIWGGGYISGLIFHPTTADLLYARTDVGGAYRWDNTNSKWIPLTDMFSLDDSELFGVVSLALDPSDSNRVYLACGQYLPSWARDGAILRSSNRGATWTRTELPGIKVGGNSDARNTGERLAVDPNLNSILFFGTNQNGLYKSTDYGATWTQVSGFNTATGSATTSCTFVTFDKGSTGSGIATQVIWVGVNTTSGNALYRSTNGGTSWAPVTGGPGTGFIPQKGAWGFNRTLYITYGNAPGLSNLTNGSVWKITSGLAWTNITPLAPQPAGGDAFGYCGISVVPGSSTTTDKLVVFTLDRWAVKDECFRSANSGASWTALTSIDTYASPGAPWKLDGYDPATYVPHWSTAAALDPINGSRVFFGSGNGVWSSPNVFGSTVTWTFTDNGLEETVPRELVSPPSGTAFLISAIADFGGFRHENLTSSPTAANFFTPINGSNSSIAFAQNNPNIVVRAHAASPSFGSRSTDGGITWTEFANMPAGTASGGYLTINASGTRIVYVPAVQTGFTAAPYYSTNGGLNWSATSGGPTGTNLPVADRVNDNKFYIYAGSSLYLSTNGGVNWSVAKTGLPTGAGKLRAVPGSEGDLWLPTPTGLWRATDSGPNFAQVAVGVVTDAVQVGFGAPAPGFTYPTVYVYGTVGGIEGVFRSHDTGASWVRVDDDAHRYGYPRAITGDARTYGRIFLGTEGRGVIAGTPVAGIIADGTYKVLARHSGKSIDLTAWNTGDHADVQQYTYGGGNNQRWVFTHLGNNRYRITNLHSKKPLEVSAGIVDVSSAEQADYQIWKVTSVGSGYYKIENVATGKGLDVQGSSTADGADIIQWTISGNGGLNQNWSITAP